MTTTELKTIENLVKEVLDVVKKPKEENSEATQELVKKVDKINFKIDKKSKDYVRELQKAFDTYQQKRVELLSENGVTDSEDLKDFVSIMTNEIIELKSNFEKFSEEFSDLSINTTMATSKEILSMKNHVLSFNDSIDGIKKYLSDIDWTNLLVTPVSNSVNETFKSNLNSFKDSIFNIVAKILAGTDNIINKLAENSTVIEGFENILGEVKETQQKNKDEIVKIINAQVNKSAKNVTNAIHKETNNLLPQIAKILDSVGFDEKTKNIKKSIKDEANSLIPKMAQLVGAISFEENAEDIKETVKEETGNLILKITQLIGAISFDENFEDIHTNIKEDIDNSVAKVTELINSLPVDEKAQSIKSDIKETINDSILQITELIDTIAYDGKEEIKANIKEEVENAVSKLSQSINDISFNKNFTEIKEAVKNEIDNSVSKIQELVNTLSFDENAEDIKSSIKETTDNLVSQINQIPSLISFDESAEDIKETVKNEINDSVSKIQELVNTLSFDENVEDIKLSIKETIDNLVSQINQIPSLISFDESAEDIKETIKNEIDNSVSKIKELITSLSFDESTEDIKETIKTEIYDNISRIKELIDTLSFDKKAEDLKETVKTEISSGVLQITELVDAISFEGKEDIKSSIKEEVENIVPKLTQLIGAISFDENAEDIKDTIKDVNYSIDVTNQNIEANISTSNEILNKITKLQEDANFNPDVASNILDKVNNINDTVGNNVLAKISKINTTLDTVTNDFNILTKGAKEDTEEYVYTLLDLESDISKVRILLDELTKGLQSGKNTTEASTKDISDKIGTIGTRIKHTEDIFNQVLLTQFESLNDDITSISKRTNKLILTSDDSSLKLEKNIEDFQNILKKITSTVNNFDKSAIIKNISLRTDNIQKMLSASLQSDNAINEAFIHLAGWIDETSAEIGNIKTELNKLNIQFNTINEISATQHQSGNFEKFAELLVMTNKKLDDTNQRLNKIEEKTSDTKEIKSSVEFLVAQIQLINENMAENKMLNKKIDNMEKQIQQLLSCIEEEE